MLRRLRHARGLVAELFAFARLHDVWWPLALVLALLVVGALVVVGQTVAPFLYTIF